MARPTRIDLTVATSISNRGSNIYSGNGSNYIVETITGVLYLFFIDDNTDPAFKKSTDYGFTWSAATVLKATSCVAISVWYDRWSSIDADLIHVAYAEQSGHNVYYRSVNAASSDTLSTEYMIFDGASAGNSGMALSISRMIGGNLIAVGTIDDSTESFAEKSTDVGVNWGNIAAVYEAQSDKVIMMPGWGADNQDGMLFYYDNSATEVSVKYYDDSADSWSEASLATGVTLPTGTLGHFSAAVDIINSQNLCVFWTAVDAANADLRVFKVTQSTQTETAANCVLNSTDDQGNAGISIFGSTWYVFYSGLSAGTDAYPFGKIYYKTTVNGGDNWSAETVLSNCYFQISGFFVNPIINKSYGVCHSFLNGITIIDYNAPLTFPRATFQLGI